jgi:hypothetical protein
MAKSTSANKRIHWNWQPEKGSVIGFLLNRECPGSLALSATGLLPALMTYEEKYSKMRLPYLLKTVAHHTRGGVHQVPQHLVAPGTTVSMPGAGLCAGRDRLPIPPVLDTQASGQPGLHGCLRLIHAPTAASMCLTP